MPKQRKNDPKDATISKAFRQYLSLSSPPARKEWFVSTCGSNRQARDLMFEDNRKTYEETGNPLPAWRAFVLARETCENGQMEIPEWVLEYLDGVANGLLSNTNKNTLNDCALHLGFDLKDGGSSVFRQAWNEQIRSTAVVYVILTLYDNPEMSIEDACKLIRERLAKEQLEYEWETIRGWYHEAKRTTT